MTTKAVAVSTVIVLYAVALGAFLVGWAPDVLKIPVTIGGVLLAALIPELTHARPLIWRVLLLCVPVVGVAAVQIVDAGNSAAEAQKLSSRLSGLQLSAIRDHIRECERRAQELVTPDPRDALEQLSFADKAMQFLADMDGLRAAVYRARAAAPRLSAGDRTRALEIAIRLDGERQRYQAAAVFFAQTIMPTYSIIRDGRKTIAASMDMQAQMKGAADAIAAFAAKQPTAGLFGRLGLLAIARNRQDEALYYFYRGMHEDPEFLSIFESLGYSGWALNQDSHVALRYARAGAKLTEELAVRPETEVEQAAALSPPDVADSLRAQWAALKESWVMKINAYRDRFALQAAYYSALEFENEAEARAEAWRLVAEIPDDAEYQDALGFVLMRFARNEDELQKAATLFRSAMINARGELATRSSADGHLREAAALIAQVEGGATSNAMADLAKTCR